MTTRTTFITLCATGLLLISSAAFRGGCSPTPCPDLYVACPELECADGFKVDKSGCAICECVGDVDPAPPGCHSDSDCADSQHCVVGDIVVMSVPSSDGGTADANDGALVESEPLGVCIDIEPGSCEDLDEWSCIEAAECGPVYSDECLALCADDSPNCFCEPEFFACVHIEPNSCWGAWVDENGTCRAPNDGVYPDECCTDSAELP